MIIQAVPACLMAAQAHLNLLRQKPSVQLPTYLPAPAPQNLRRHLRNNHRLRRLWRQVLLRSNLLPRPAMINFQIVSAHASFASLVFFSHFRVHGNPDPINAGLDSHIYGNDRWDVNRCKLKIKLNSLLTVGNVYCII